MRYKVLVIVTVVIGLGGLGYLAVAELSKEKEAAAAQQKASEDLLQMKREAAGAVVDLALEFPDSYTRSENPAHFLRYLQNIAAADSPKMVGINLRATLNLLDCARQSQSVDESAGCVAYRSRVKEYWRAFYPVAEVH